MRKINVIELENTNGGDTIGIIDGACATVGVVSLFTGVGAFVTGFCAGWGIGRWLTS